MNPGEPHDPRAGADPSAGSGFDPATYGRSFADVYDRWYPDDEATASAVDRLRALAPAGGHVLELGVGTGRLALPLARAGLAVTGLDASTEMLGVLAGKDPGGTVERVAGDVGRSRDWPTGPFHLVVAANNLVCNLADAASQEACLRTAADHLRPGGHVVVEAFVPAPLERGRRLEVSDVRSDAVVMIATDSDPDTGVVVAQHMEFRDGQPVRLRPWRIRVASPEEIDRWAGAAGLERTDRWGDWAGGPFDPHGTAHVSVYTRSAR